MKPWHEQDEFWEVMFPKLFGKFRWEVASVEVDHIISLLDLKPDCSILDLCCGPGRHSLEFARRGYSVTAVDRTQYYIESARQKARDEGLDIQFIAEDMRSFNRSGVFDVVLNLFTSFGYFDDQQDDELVLQNINMSLKPGGTVIFEMMGKEILARVFRPRDWYEEDGVFFLEDRKPIDGWTRMQNRWLVIDENGHNEAKFSHRLFSGGEMKLLLEKNGFHSIKLYGHLEGIPYDHNAVRLVVVAEKE